MKTNATTTKIPLSGANAYPQYLVKHHRKLLHQFLTKLQVSPHAKRQVLKLWKSKVDLHNITWVYQHSMQTFTEYLISGRFQELQNFSEATFQSIKTQ